MTDLTLTQFGDTWVREDRPNTNYGSTSTVHLLSGANDRRGLLRVALPNIAGRTVLEATLTGRAAGALAAQTLSLWPITGPWSPGKVTWPTPAVNAGALVTTTIGVQAAGSLVEWDVTDHLQAVADGTPWIGWRLDTDDPVDQMFVAFDSGQPAWELFLSLSDDPDVPTDLRPEGGNITSTTPVLSWTYDDAGIESSSQAQSQVQVDKPTPPADPDGVTPDYDSGWEANIDPEWDLTGEHTLVGAGPHYWRVRVQDVDGNESDWSDWAEFGVLAKPSLVVDAPTGAIGDPAVTVQAHLSSGTVASWLSYVTGADRSDIRYRTGTRTGAVDYRTPLRAPDGRRVLVDEVAQWIYLRVYPTGDWTTSVGETTYVDAWIPVTWDDDAGIVAPTDLVVTQTAPGDPRHVWMFEMTDVPESYLLQVDGKTVASIGADDVPPVAGVVTITDGGEIAPLRPHQLRVRAVSDSGRSDPATVTGYAYEAEGVWLLPEDDTIDPVVLEGTAVGGFARVDHRATYVTNTGDEVDIIYGAPARSGTFEGTVSRGLDEDALWAAVDAIEALRSSRVRTARMVWGAQSALVRLRDPDVTSDDDILPNNLRHRVRFGFVETVD